MGTGSEPSSFSYQCDMLHSPGFKHHLNIDEWLFHGFIPDSGIGHIQLPTGNLSLFYILNLSKLNSNSTSPPSLAPTFPYQWWHPHQPSGLCQWQGHLHHNFESIPNFESTLNIHKINLLFVSIAASCLESLYYFNCHPFCLHPSSPLILSNPSKM